MGAQAETPKTNANVIKAGQRRRRSGTPALREIISIRGNPKIRIPFLSFQPVQQ